MSHKNVVLYHANAHKKINGTLFYCFEYYAFVKQFVPNVEYLLLNTTKEELAWYKSIFAEKYHADAQLLAGVRNVLKRTGLVAEQVQHAVILDIHSYDRLKPFLGHAQTIRVYSNDTHTHLNKNVKHTFYGFYPYQPHDYTTRLKFYVELHKTFDTNGNKTFVTSLNCDSTYILSQLNMSSDNACTKEPNQHNANLFSTVNRVIYWHGVDRDTNNRAVVESYIHNLPLEVYLNGWYNDSIYERTEELKRTGLTNFTLTADDALVRDFVNDCKPQPV